LGGAVDEKLSIGSAMDETPTPTDKKYAISGEKLGDL
jgi:hypothetical protein